MPTATVNEFGQIQIPKALRLRLGITQGSRVVFDLVDDHLELRVEPTDVEGPAAGFGMLKSPRHAVPADLDPAGMMRWFDATNTQR
ncbi:MAG: AbrB/MazE/SpoVT family DNA-binding domain-containing protein [Chromatiaceae bacterium]|nr:AbrB/MazE/SpoVT family DNA-binding domain-containing protein [Chromatiaceae bacterium]